MGLRLKNVVVSSWVIPCCPAILQNLSRVFEIITNVASSLFSFFNFSLIVFSHLSLALYTVVRRNKSNANKFHHKLLQTSQRRRKLWKLPGYSQHSHRRRVRAVAFSSPVSSHYAKNAWDHDPPFGDQIRRRRRRTACIFRLRFSYGSLSKKHAKML